MHGISGEAGTNAISATAAVCRERQHLAEPLWFAGMCKDFWAGNAAKELLFILTKYSNRKWSDRTCRSWASGDAEPPASVLAILIISDHGFRVVGWIMRDTIVTWWVNLQRALRITAQVDQMDLG